MGQLTDRTGGLGERRRLAQIGQRNRRGAHQRPVTRTAAGSTVQRRGGVPHHDGGARAASPGKPPRGHAGSGSQCRWRPAPSTEQNCWRCGQESRCCADPLRARTPRRCTWPSGCRRCTHRARTGRAHHRASRAVRWPRLAAGTRTERPARHRTPPRGEHPAARSHWIAFSDTAAVIKSPIVELRTFPAVCASRTTILGQRSGSILPSA